MALKAPAHPSLPTFSARLLLLLLLQACLTLVVHVMTAFIITRDHHHHHHWVMQTVNAPHYRHRRYTSPPPIHPSIHPPHRPPTPLVSCRCFLAANRPPRQNLNSACLTGKTKTRAWCCRYGVVFLLKSLFPHSFFLQLQFPSAQLTFDHRPPSPPHHPPPLITHHHPLTHHHHPPTIYHPFITH